MTAPLAQTTLAATDLSEGLVLMVVGMGVVFVALVTLWVMVALIERFAGSDPRPEPASSPARKPVTGPADPGVTPELVAVLSAAAATALGTGRVRVTRITPLVRGGSTAWTAGGRRSNMNAHRTGRTRPAGSKG